MVGFVSGLREVGQRTPEVHPLAQKGHVGEASGNFD